MLISHKELFEELEQIRKQLSSHDDQFMLIFENEFEALFEKEIEKENGEKTKIGFDISGQKIEKILAKEKIKIGKEEKIDIKEFADDVLRIYQMAKYFALEKKRAWNEDYQIGDFYTKIEAGYLVFYEDAYRQIVGGYNDLRNYLTKKPYSEEKWKLNFENPTLANGWDKNKESDNSAVILRKDGKYFLGLMAKGHNKIFDDRNLAKFQQDLASGKYEKVIYKLLPGANKMLPKVFFSASNIAFYNPSEKVLEIRNYSSHSKNGTPQKGFQKKDFKLSDCHILIDFFKKSIAKHLDWKNFNFNFSETEKYQDISEFYRQVENGGYKISFQDIAEKYIAEKNQSGELYLFEIFNQDFAEGKTGKKNLHTMYWEALFSSENMAGNFPFKLNGQAEIFYRPASIEAEKEQRNFSREITKNKRYTENKIFFHCPLTLNRTKENLNQYKFNDQINVFLAKNTDINVIGVDRGEKHLAYFSVINQRQEILKSGSLNELNGVDYGKKLGEKAEQRKTQRQDWSEVENIKDLKKGYISQVVRKLADLAIEHNAIIVFEDLNMRFKQIRGGIEKSVYQQLEKALIEKLNFLVKKDEIDPAKAGHLLKAYQLVAPFETFEKMGKQTGVIFYTQASYTSKIDPLTGWRPNLYLKYANARRTQEDIAKNFKSIKHNQQENHFEFEYEITNASNKQGEVLQKTNWVLGSKVERYFWSRFENRNKGGYKYYENLTADFKVLFESAGFNLQKNILEQIKALDASKENAKFFRDFVFLWKLLCQIRNTQKEKSGDENDFILSPVFPFFDSRKADEFGKNLPKNGDDNGAFNIARKGIVILERISKKTGGKVDWSELSISQIAWDNFAQSRIEKK